MANNRNGTVINPETFAYGSRTYCDEQYLLFKKVIGQLTGGDPIMGDLTGKWVVFADGYVAGLCCYATSAAAAAFGGRTIPTGTPGFLVVLVNMDKHDIKWIDVIAHGSVDAPADMPND